MDEKRKGKIAYQLHLLNIRKNFSFQDIINARRRIGNLVKEPEMVRANITKEELLEFGKFTVREVFEKQIAGL